MPLGARWTAAALIAAAITGCGAPDSAFHSDDIATMLHMADPRADKQLNSGFYAFYGWGRFTGRTFSATLKPPPTAGKKGALLIARFGLPETSIEALHSITLAATVNGVAVAPQSYAKAGEFMFVRDVPAGAFHQGAAVVNFTLDKVVPPHGAEGREIGVLMNTLGFEAK